MSVTRTVLFTGSAGYIGSYTTLALLQAGFNLVVLNNLCNASAESLRRVAQLSGCAPVFVKGDIRDRKAEREVGWKAQRGLNEMMQEAWRWQSMNPDGYR